MLTLNFETREPCYAEYADAAARLNRHLGNPPVKVDAKLLMNFILEGHDSDSVFTKFILALRLTTAQRDLLPNPVLKPEPTPAASAASHHAPKTKDSPSSGSAARPDERNGEAPRKKESERIEARLNPYIAATPEKHARYEELVKTDPAYAARLLSLKDMFSLEREHQLSEKQIAGAREWLNSQHPKTTEWIGERLQQITHPLLKDMKMVELVVAGQSYQNRRTLTEKGGEILKKTAPAPSAGARIG